MKSKYRLKVVSKLMIGFGIVLASVVFSGIFVYRMMIENKEETRHIKEEIIPTMNRLGKLNNQVLDSKILIKHWVESQAFGTPQKEQLQTILNENFPKVKRSLKADLYRLNDTERKAIAGIVSNAEAYFKQIKSVTQDLDTLDKYNDLYLVAKYRADVEEGNALMELADNITRESKKMNNELSAQLFEANNRMDEALATYSTRVTIASVLLVILILFIGFLLARSIIFPINYVKKILFSMSSGELPDKPVRSSSDEIGQMGAALNNLIAGLRQKGDFAIEIGKENFDYEFKPLSTKDTLGNSLLQMRESLAKASREAEARRIENQQRSWSAQGLANFNELIRNHSDTLNEFTTHIISELTDYLEAQLGGFYVVSKTEEGKKEEKFLYLDAFYAFDRQKFTEKKIKFGENLVGQAVLEKDTIFITDIPDNYTDIVSGLGQDKPKSLLIVPLKLNDVVYGVIELASFKVFEKFEIDFVEKVGEIFASTLSNIRIKEQTARLLEESNEKSEKLARQELLTQEKIENLEKSLEDRDKQIKEQSSRYNNLEQEYKNELKSAQRKLRLANDELKSLGLNFENTLNILNNSMGVLEVGMNAEISKANNKYLQMTGMTLIDLTGKSIDSFISQDTVNSEEYLSLWQKLREGETISGINTYYFRGKEKHFFETYTPVMNHKKEYYKIVITSVDLDNLPDIENAD